jgi:hypothetical protein
MERKMRVLMIAAAGAALLALGACGGKGDDKLGEQAQEAMENKADIMDAAADNMTGTAEDMMEAKADATREAGEAKEEAIDRSDVNADAMSSAEKNAIINGN